jgi:uncharacterized protein YjlB
VDKFELSEAHEFCSSVGKSSAQILVAIAGGAVLESAGCNPVRFGKGDAVVVPAATERFVVVPQPDVKFLKSFVPGVAVPEPETTI